MQRMCASCTVQDERLQELEAMQQEDPISKVRGVSGPARGHENISKR